MLGTKDSFKHKNREQWKVKDFKVNTNQKIASCCQERLDCITEKRGFTIAKCLVLLENKATDIFINSGERVQGVRHLTCTQPNPIQTLAMHVVPLNKASTKPLNLKHITLTKSWIVLIISPKPKYIMLKIYYVYKAKLIENLEKWNSSEWRYSRCIFCLLISKISKNVRECMCFIGHS